MKRVGSDERTSAGTRRSQRCGRFFTTQSQPSGHNLAIRRDQTVPHSSSWLPYELLFDAMPHGHVEFLQQLQTYHRTRNGLFVHAGINPRDGAIEQQTEKMLVWGTYRFLDEYRGSETIVYGHYSNAILDEAAWPQPIIRPNSIGIDTIKYGVLTAVQLPERRIFQSARYGQAQEDGWIY